MSRSRGVMLLILLFAGMVSCDAVKDKNDSGAKAKKEYYEDGTLKSELYYKDGKLNGCCAWYLSNGKKYLEVTFRNDTMDGPMRRWHENGNMMEESWYKNGVKDGVYREYSLKGIKVAEGHYVNGELNGEFHRWHENGQVFWDGQYSDGMMDGSWFLFYPDGNLAAKADFDKGTGTQTSYEHSGYQCLVTHFVDNVKHGREVYYNPDGRVTRVAVYEYGEWVGDEDLEEK